MKSYKQTFNEQMRNNPNARVVEGEELKRLQEVLLDMFLEIRTVCENHNLTCMLLGGSTLGAVRHKGFIPWDDDLDIAMTRKDYEKFKRIFVEELGEKYVLNAPNYNGRPTNRFPKILKRGTKYVEIDEEDDDRACIKIDVFILENVPDSILLRYAKGFWCTFLMFLGGHVYSYETAKHMNRKLNRREIIGKCFSVLKSERLFDRFDKACRSKNGKSRNLGIPSGRKHYFGEILPRESFFPCSDGVFEGRIVSLPADTDLYLRNLYGDYMKIPPKNKREKHYIEKIEFECDKK